LILDIVALILIPGLSLERVLKPFGVRINEAFTLPTFTTFFRNAHSVPEIIYPESFVVRKPAVNLKPGDEIYFKNAESRKIPEVDLLRLKNVYVLFNSLFNPGKFRFYPAYTHAGGDISFKAKLFRLSRFWRKVQKLDKGLWVTHNWSEGYFHWLTDVLPRIMITMKYADGHKVILPHYYEKYKYIMDSLAELRVPHMYYQHRAPLLVKNILIPGFTGPTGNYNESLIRMVRERFAGHLSDRVASRKIYISRRHAPTRKILNEKEMEAILEQHGFEIHFFEYYDLKKQIGLMAETKYLVGVHGGGLTNMLFMKEGGRVLELRNAGDSHNNCYFSLASALGLDYYYQFNKGNSAVTQVTDLEVNLEELKQNLLLMMKGSSTTS
jgi:capsular polysaccharide biosynthesis protein